MAANESKGLSIAALVIGIVAVVFGLVPVLGLVLGVLALVFGIIGAKKRAGRGMAITGIVTGSVAIVVGIIAFLVVFIAMPGLQRSARDTARKNDVAQAATEVTSYETNYRGQLPEVMWLQDLQYTQVSSIVGSGLPTTETAVYKTGLDCDGGSGPRAYSVTVKLESGDLYCQGS